MCQLCSRVIAFELVGAELVLRKRAEFFEFFVAARTREIRNGRKSSERAVSVTGLQCVVQTKTLSSE